MSYLEELLPEFRKGAKIRRKCWRPNEFIYLKNNTLFNEENIELDGSEMDIWDIFTTDDWELYQEPIDWDYIIKNNCLCWFWDEDYEEGRALGYLSCVLKDEKEKFLKNGISYWEHCYPVRKDEVAFYTITKGETEND